MRIKALNDRFVVVRGDEHEPQYFSFFVDADRSSWSKFSAQAHKYIIRTSAAETIQHLRLRQRNRRRLQRVRS